MICSRRLILFFLLIISRAAFPQEVIFSVLAVKGNVYAGNGQPGKQRAVKTGDSLQSSLILITEKNSYIALAGKNGIPVELKAAGTYKLEDLYKKAGARNSSSSKKFTDFIFSELNGPVKSRNMKTIGAVVRQGENAIDPGIPSFTETAERSFTFSRYPYSHNAAYLFTILNPSGETVFLNEVKDTSLSVDLSDLGLVQNKDYRWCVTLSGNKNISSDTNSIVLSLSYKSRLMADTLSSLRADLTNMDNAVTHIILAHFYERNKYNCDAVKEYEAALRLAPGVEEYQKLYAMFLLKNGMLKKLGMLAKAFQ